MFPVAPLQEPPVGQIEQVHSFLSAIVLFKYILSPQSDGVFQDGLMEDVRASFAAKQTN